MLAFALVVYRVLRPSGPALRQLLRNRPGGWLDRLRYVWFPALVALPVSLVVVAWLGYFYTARALEMSLETTILLGVTLALANGLLMRWLFIARRRVAYEDAKRRRDHALSEAKGKEGGKPSESSVPAIDEEKLDLPAISLQTRQLFQVVLLAAALTGLYAIWADALPALRMLDRVQLYPSVRIIEETEGAEIPILETANGERGAAGAEGAPESEAPGAPALPLPMGAQGVGLGGDGGAGEQAAPPLSVTVADVGLALIVLIATVVLFIALAIFLPMWGMLSLVGG